MGYHRAGFDVTGVDITDQPRYPFEFIQADAMTFALDGFDAIHASPPCQDHSALSAAAGKHGTGWMLPATLARLAQAGVPWIVENVAGAGDVMAGSVVLCGTEFGLSATVAGRRVWLRRHRRFASDIWLWGAGGCCCAGRPTISPYGHGQGGSGNRIRGPGTAQAHREAMGISWMTRAELAQAIPPAYTEHIGEQLIDHISGGLVAATDAATHHERPVP